MNESIPPVLLPMMVAYESVTCGEEVVGVAAGDDVAGAAIAIRGRRLTTRLRGCIIFSVFQ